MPTDEERSDANNSNNNDEKDTSVVGSLLAALSRSFLYGLKSLPRSMIKASLQKQAFLTLGRRTHGKDTNYRYDGKVVSVLKNPTWIQRGVEMARGSFSGFVVFTVYDLLIMRKEEEDVTKSNTGAIRLSDHHLVTMYSTVPPHNNSLSPLILHCGAGAIAGMVFSLALDGWDMILGRAATLQKMNMDFLWRRTIHHTLGYATLFGSYECFRRLFSHGIQQYMTSGNPSSALHHAEQLGFIRCSTTTNQWDMTAVPLGTSFLAGGLAGQAHFVTDHYTRAWKLQAIEHHVVRTTFLPPLRPMAFSFLPTAFCFVAFHYGSELYERTVHDDGEHRYPLFHETLR